jgi:hypothetical protein
MDVGADSFRFTLDDPEKKSRAFRYPMSSELHVSSLDRFNSQSGIPQVLVQLEQDVLFTVATAPNYSSSQLTIQNQRALMYGYFNRIAISEMQLFYRVPTVVAGVNDVFYITNNPGGVGTPVSYLCTIPAGHYTAPLLAVAMQTVIRANVANLTTAGSFTVTAPLGQASTPPASGTVVTGFVFNTGTTDTIIFAAPPNGSTLAAQLQVWKCYRMIGTTTQSFVGYPSNIPTPIVVSYNPNLLPTDYIDIVSKALTNYKDNKDANSSEASPLGVIGRIYLTDTVVNSAITSFGYLDPNVLGSGPLAFTKKWAIPNWSQWSPNQAVNALDITLLDMFGQPLYYSNLKGCADTEWQMTLIASE